MVLIPLIIFICKTNIQIIQTNTPNYSYGLKFLGKMYKYSGPSPYPPYDISWQKWPYLHNYNRFPYNLRTPFQPEENGLKLNVVLKYRYLCQIYEWCR